MGFKVALVGRPNVGKSSLFNRICQKRVSIVGEQEGITRDRISYDTEFFGKGFTLIDTGGIDFHSTGDFQQEIFTQAQIAIAEADCIVFVVDFLSGLLTLDEEVAKLLLRSKKKVLLAVNKVDDPSKEHLLYPFFSLGFSSVFPISALQGYRVEDLLEEALSECEEKTEENSPYCKIAIVGKPNVGKSTLLNRIIREERCAVSPIAGTTRDAIETFFSVEDRQYCFIDTAGIKRKKSEKEVVEKFAFIRTQEAMEKVDICLLLLDANRGLTTEEKKILSFIEQLGKGCIVVVNKWDLIKGYQVEHCERDIKQRLPSLQYFPFVFLSAKTGKGVDKIFTLIDEVQKQREKRVGTGQLNTAIEKAMQKIHPPMIKGKRLRVYYITQVQQAPPKFILFVNSPSLMTPAYKKYLFHQIRKSYGFIGTPIFLSLKPRSGGALNG